jgi:signal peptidase
MSARTVVSRVSSAMLALAVVALAVFAIGPRTGAYRTVSILSGSMQPTFSAGDVIITTPVQATDVRPGDVITYHAPIPGRPVVTHRVVEVTMDRDRPVVTTKGDANEATDPWKARLEGRTAWRQIAVIPHAGAVIATLRSGNARKTLLYAAPSLFLGLMLLAIWAPHRPRRSESEEYADLNAIIDAVQAHLTHSFDSTCAECGSSVFAEDPCPFCDQVVLTDDRELAAA